MLLPGLNLIYGLPGETHRTHYENLAWLVRILDAGTCATASTCGRPAPTPAPHSRRWAKAPPPSAEHFATWKADVSYVFDQPMKQRVYPAGRTITGLHSFFVTSRGTWHRRLGSYSIQVVERGTARPLFEDAELTVTGHEPRYLIGARHAAASSDLLPDPPHRHGAACRGPGAVGEPRGGERNCPDGPARRSPGITPGWCPPPGAPRWTRSS